VNVLLDCFAESILILFRSPLIKGTSSRWRKWRLSRVTIAASVGAGLSTEHVCGTDSLYRTISKV
jgi:hypothetical protein